MTLQIKNLSIAVDNKPIIHALDLEIKPGQVQVIMGPNGSGKSTLANALAGHPKYKCTEGSITIDGTDITTSSPDKRARAGLFLSAQYPPELNGVTLGNFLRIAKQTLTGTPVDPIAFRDELYTQMKQLHIEPEFLKRYVNTGFSGGEKKKVEMLQLCVLRPTYAILDETDSGLDVDALKIVAESINRCKQKNTGILIITHYNRILEYITPDIVHIMIRGNIVKSGNKELAVEVEKNGYSSW